MSRTRPQLEMAPILRDLAGRDDDVATGAVLDGAAALLRAQGLHGWSVDDVAVRAGLGRTTVYRRFATRDDIVHAVLARELRQTLAAIDAAARHHSALQDKVVEGGLVALRALRGSIVERLLQLDPATFLPFLTTDAGPLLAIARQALVTGARAAGATASDDELGQIAEAAARLGLSLILTRDTVLPVDDEDALRAALRRIVAPMLTSLSPP